MSTTADRVLITDPSFGNGWYEDPESGKKTRKQDGDRVVTRAEYDEMLSIAQGGGDEQPDHEQGHDPESTRQETVAAAATQAPVQLTSGKLAVGKTTTIQCAWVEQADRTPAQQKLLDSNFEGVEPGKGYEAMKRAAGGKQVAMPCGAERTIKVQDAFQVRFCPDHQKAWRNELRRRKTAARRAERKANGATQSQPAEA